MYSFAPGKDEELWGRNAEELLGCRVVDPVLPELSKAKKGQLEDCPSWILEWEASWGAGRKIIEPVGPDDPEAA